MTLEEAARRLFHAARSGNVNEAEAALDSGACVNVEDDWQRTPLHMAAAYGRTGIARWLIERGADVSAMDAWRRTPLMVAAKNGHADIVEVLRDHARTGGLPPAPTTKDEA